MKIKETCIKIFKNIKLRQKLFISYILIAIIPLIVLGIYSYNQAKEFLMNQEIKNLEDNFNEIAINMDYKLNKFNSIIKYVSINTRLAEIFNSNYSDMYLLYKDITGTVKPIISTIKGIDTDIQEMVVYTSNETIPKVIGSIRHIDDIEFWMKNISYKTNWYISTDSLIGVAGMMRQYKSEINNIVYMEIDYDSVLSNIELQNMSQYPILITDEADHIIYEKDIDNYEILVVDNHKKLVHFIYELPTPQWSMNIFVPIELITISPGRILLATAFVIIICFAVLLFMVYLFSRAFFRRIEYLNDRMKIVSNGNLDININSKSKDEVGSLINGVGSMVQNIKKLMDEVYHKDILQKKAEIKVLQSQINPHFLYNTLSLINWRAIKIKDDKISFITNKLSKYYRTMLNKGESYISIQDEIENIKAYIDIQLIMHDDNFEVEYDIDHTVYDFCLLNFTLQPIVENAIQYGIDEKEDGKGKIKISATVWESDSIKFIIEDNGPGINKDLLMDILAQKNTGYGLRNVNERIKLIFGNQYGLYIKSEVGQGTQVEIVIPKYNINNAT